jgi:hypothetical protein
MLVTAPAAVSCTQQFYLQAPTLTAQSFLCYVVVLCPPDVCVPVCASPVSGVLSWWLGLSSILHVKPEEWSAASCFSFIQDYFAAVNLMPHVSVSGVWGSVLFHCLTSVNLMPMARDVLVGSGLRVQG